MNKKLTLTIEEDVIKRAKKHAEKEGRSLSNMVENYFRLISAKEADDQKKELSPRIKNLKGILKVDEGFDYKKILEEEISVKHG